MFDYIKEKEANMKGSASCLCFCFIKESLLHVELLIIGFSTSIIVKKWCVSPPVLQSNRMRRGTVLVINVQNRTYLS